MSLFSVNTNPGAAAAVRYLADTQAMLATTQRRVSTGRRVESVRDNGASWAIAQQQRGDIGSLDAIRTGLQRARTITDVALAAGEAVSDLLMRMGERALAASDASLSAESLEVLNTEFETLKTQLTRTVSEAGFDGVNILDDGAQDFQVRAGLAVTSGVEIRLHPNQRRHPGRTQEVPVLRGSVVEVRAELLGLDGPKVVLSASATLTDAATRAAVRTAIEDSFKNVSASLSRLGATSRALDRQEVFLGKLQDNLRTGVSALVDADLAKESAKLQAMQVREQLGVQALGVANSAPSVLLSLFR